MKAYIETENFNHILTLGKGLGILEYLPVMLYIASIILLQGHGYAMGNL